MTTTIKDTLIFTFTTDFANQNEIIDYYVDVLDDDEQVLVTVHVDDVDADLVNSMDDEQLCDYFGMNPESLLYTNRSEFQ